MKKKLRLDHGNEVLCVIMIQMAGGEGLKINDVIKKDSCFRGAAGFCVFQ